MSSTIGGVWSYSDEKKLKKVAQKFSRDLEKNERWRRIAKEMNRPKRDCYDKYQDLKKKKKEKERAKSVAKNEIESRYEQDQGYKIEESKVGTSSNYGKMTSLSLQVNEFDQDDETDVFGENEMKTEKQKNKNQNEGTNAYGRRSPKLEMEEIEDFDNEFENLCVSGNETKQENKRSARMNEVELEEEEAEDNYEQDNDFEEEEEEEEENDQDHISIEPMSLEEAKIIKKLLFGTRKTQQLDNSWKKQGFFFTKQHDLGYGLVQLKGGPCGVMAAVQAFVLKELMFVENSCAEWENPNSKEQVQALIKALATIIWQASNGKNATVCIYDSTCRGSACFAAQNYRPDGFIDKMMKHRCNSQEQVCKVIESNIGSFMSKSGPGVGMLLCSLIISRGCHKINGDIDKALGNNNSLIGNHNYASQELVNLLLVGYASSNIFDGNQSLEDAKDSIVLQGIRSQSSIGFLTLYEHYEYMQVGSYYKTPKFPIWVLCSESHYSVLFSDSTGCMSESNTQQFDLFYYDELGNQDEVYRLSVDPDPLCPVEHDTSGKNMVSPIEECIRTKWKGAVVDWNGSDPLL